MILAFAPYYKYILFLILILGFLWVNRIFITDKELRGLLIESFQDETQRISGKSISAFVCVSSLIMGWFISILYSERHIPPEYQWWLLLSLISGLYGIKEVGKISSAKFNAPFNGNPNIVNAQQPTTTIYNDETLNEWKNSGRDINFSEWFKETYPDGKQ